MSNSTTSMSGGTDNGTSFGTSGNTTTPEVVAEPITFDWVAIFAAHLDAKRLGVALLTWVAYDYALTIDDSINLFWKFRWSVSKVTYLLSRYVSLVTVTLIVMRLFMPSPTLTYCTVSPWMEIGGSAILIVIVNLVMVTRVYALWNRDKRVLIVALMGFCGNIGSYLILVSYSYAKGAFFVTYPPFTGCVVFPGYDKGWLIFVTSIGFETVIIVLTIYKSWSVAIQRGIRTPLYTLLLEDGAIYYFFILLSQMLSIITVWVPSALSAPVGGAYPSIAVSGIACNRLFTRLQRLLVSRGKGQTDFLTADLISTSAPSTSYGGTPTKYGGHTAPPTRATLDNEISHSRISPNRSGNPRRGSDDSNDNEFGMETISKKPTQSRRLERDASHIHTEHHDVSAASQHGGNLEKKIEPSKDISTATGNTRSRQEPTDQTRQYQRMRRQVKDVEVTVQVDGEVPGSLTYRRNVLDPSPRNVGELSNISPNDDIGRLIVSRVGRYDS